MLDDWRITEVKPSRTRSHGPTRQQSITLQALGPWASLTEAQVHILSTKDVHGIPCGASHPENHRGCYKQQIRTGPRKNEVTMKCDKQQMNWMLRTQNEWPNFGVPANFVNTDTTLVVDFQRNLLDLLIRCNSFHHSSMTIIESFNGLHFFWWICSPFFSPVLLLHTHHAVIRYSIPFLKMGDHPHMKNDQPPKYTWNIP